MNGKSIVYRGCHLAGYKPVIDKFVKLVVVAADFVLYRLGSTLERNRTYCFVRVLRSRSGSIHVGFYWTIILAVISLNKLQSFSLGIIRNSHAVGTDVSNERDLTFALDLYAFVEFLSRLRNHRRAEAQLGYSVLLHSRSGKRRSGFGYGLRPLDVVYLPRAFFASFDYSVGNFFCFDLYFFIVYVNEFTLERRCVFTQILDKLRRNSPVFLRYETSYFSLPVDYHFKRDGLYSACRKSALYLMRYDRRKLISHKSVKHSSGLLSVHKPHIDFSGIFKGMLYCFFGDFVENYSYLFILYAAHVGKVPRYSLSFAVGVGSEINGIALGNIFLYHLYYGLFVLGYDVLGLEVVLNVDAQTLLRQIADVPFGRHYPVAATQIFGDGLCLMRRLYNYKFHISP